MGLMTFQGLEPATPRLDADIAAAKQAVRDAEMHLDRMKAQLSEKEGMKAAHEEASKAGDNPEKEPAGDTKPETPTSKKAEDEKGNKGKR